MNELIFGTVLILDVSHFATRRQRGRLRIFLDHVLLELERFWSHRAAVVPPLRFVVLCLDHSVGDFALLLLRFSHGYFLHTSCLLRFLRVSLYGLLLFPATHKWWGRWRSWVNRLILEPERTVALRVLGRIFQLVPLIVWELVLLNIEHRLRLVEVYSLTLPVHWSSVDGGQVVLASLRPLLLPLSVCRLALRVCRLAIKVLSPSLRSSLNRAILVRPIASALPSLRRILRKRFRLERVLPLGGRRNRTCCSRVAVGPRVTMLEPWRRNILIRILVLLSLEVTHCLHVFVGVASSVDIAETSAKWSVSNEASADLGLLTSVQTKRHGMRRNCLRFLHSFYSWI